MTIDRAVFLAEHPIGRPRPELWPEPSLFWPVLVAFLRETPLRDFSMKPSSSTTRSRITGKFDSGVTSTVLRRAPPRTTVFIEESGNPDPPEVRKCSRPAG